MHGVGEQVGQQPAEAHAVGLDLPTAHGPQVLEQREPLLPCRDGLLRFARAAHPYPVYLPRAGEPEQWQSPGTLLGIFEAEYPAQTRELPEGDPEKVLGKLRGLRGAVARGADGDAAAAPKLDALDTALRYLEVRRSLGQGTSRDESRKRLPRAA